MAAGGLPACQAALAIAQLQITNLQAQLTALINAALPLAQLAEDENKLLILLRSDVIRNNKALCEIIDKVILASNKFYKFIKTY